MNEPVLAGRWWWLPAALWSLIGLTFVAASATAEQPGVRQHLQPVVAEKGMVAAAHPLAAQAGVSMLRAGGNAIDALVATQMVLNVVEPGSSGIGGGCFILYYDGKTRQTFCIDGREETPAAARRADYLDATGNVLPEPTTGGIAVGVPGTVAAMWRAHGRWGKLPVARVLEPAIRLAEDGIGVTPHLHWHLASNRTRLARFPSSRAVFLHADGSVPDIGEILRQPDLARTFRILAEQGPKAFYDGDIARDLVQTVQEAAFRPGRMTLEDLHAYRAVDRQPVRFSYRGNEIVSVPPPSSGGITLGLMLGVLEQVDLAGRKAGTLDELDWLARAGAIAFADRNAYLGDQDWSPDIDMRRLLERGRVAARAEAARHATPGPAFPAGPGPEAGQSEGNHTTHLSVVDADRNVVSCTTTIEESMGSALVVAGRGFLLNNELTDFDLNKASGPNAFDPGRRPRRSALSDNKEPAGKRPRSSMTPVLVFRDGRPVLTAGSPGGSFIIGIVAQILVNVLDHDMNMQRAIDAPRLSSQNRPLNLESLYPDRNQLMEGLQGRGWKLSNDQFPGNAHGIRLRPDGKLEGGTDPRGEGTARGY